MANQPPPPPGMGPRPAHTPLPPMPAQPPKPIITAETAMAAITSSADPRPAPKPPVPKPTIANKPAGPDPDFDASASMKDQAAAAQTMLNEAFSMEPDEFTGLYDEARPPSVEHPYSPQLGRTFSLSNAMKSFQKQIDEQAARIAMDYAGVDALAEALDRAMAVDLADIIAEAEAAPSDYTDVMFGHPGKELVLARTGHMIRVLAPKKAGKTTFCLEVIRCSATGETAFGSTEIAPLGEGEAILFIDPELSEIDWKHYVRQSFGGFDTAYSKRIKRIAVAEAPGFDLMTMSTRDQIIRVCNEYNVTRVIFDSYSKLMLSGSVSKESDVKTVLQHWSEIQAATNIQESFWVGHINNTGEARSSGSILWDASFQALFHLSALSDGTRTFTSQQGRMTAEVNGAPISLDPTTKRPVINFDQTARETKTTVTPQERKEGTESKNTAVINSILPLIVEILGDQPAASMVDADGAEHHDRRGGLGFAEVCAEILKRWESDTEDFGRKLGLPSEANMRQAMAKSRENGHVQQVGPKRGPGSKQWLTKPAGEAWYDEIQAAKVKANPGE